MAQVPLVLSLVILFFACLGFSYGAKGELKKFAQLYNCCSQEINVVASDKKLSYDFYVVFVSYEFDLYVVFVSYEFSAKWLCMIVSFVFLQKL